MLVLICASLCIQALAIQPVQADERQQLPDRAFEMLERASRRAPVEIRGVPLRDGLVETLLVQEFDVFAPDARIHVFDGDDERLQAPPKMRFFKGEVLGAPDSWVVISDGEHGIAGLIAMDGEVYRLHETTADHSRRHFTERIDDGEVPEPLRNWSCSADAYRVEDVHRTRMNQQQSAIVPVEGQAFSTSTKRRLKIAIDTDYELTQLLGDTSAVATYVASVTAAVSALYENDLNTVLHVGDVFTYASASDPWAATSSGAQLDEVATYWHNTPSRASIGRSTVAFISGKSTGGGVAWIGVLCGNDFEQTFLGKPGVWGGSYAVWGSVSGFVNAVSPNAVGYWDVLAYAHELGHNANSVHTHCIPSTGYGRTFVDECYNGEGGCSGGTPAVPAEKGTIMSYCHLLAPGYSNVRMIFGKSGEASEAVLPPMISHIGDETLTGTLISPASSVDSNSTGNTASFSVAGATTYSWTLVNATITGGQGSSTITYTAGATGAVDFEVTAADAKGCGAIGYGSLTIVGTAPGSVDFSGDGETDLIWRNISSGTNAVWSMDGAVQLGSSLVDPLTNLDWEMKGSGDFNGDQKPDIIWRNSADGRNAVWYMDGYVFLGSEYLEPLALQWELVSVNDFNGDQKPDLIWRNPGDGRNAIWTMNGTSRIDAYYLKPISDTNWNLVGSGDFDGDGDPDLAWRNASTGRNAIWFMDGTSRLGSEYVRQVSDLNWKIVGAGDFDGDGRADIVWRNTSSGDNAIWFMNGAERLSSALTKPVPDQNWQISGPR